MKRHEHKFVAIPITGQNAYNGKESLFGWRVECEHCYKKPKPGDHVVQIKASARKEIIPETQTVDIVCE